MSNEPAERRSPGVVEYVLVTIVIGLVVVAFLLVISTATPGPVFSNIIVSL